MADNLAERIRELEELADERGVRDQVGDFPAEPLMYAEALAAAAGLDSDLAIGLDNDLAWVEAVGGTVTYDDSLDDA